MGAISFEFGPHREDWSSGALEFDYAISFDDAPTLKFTEKIQLPEGILETQRRSQKEVVAQILDGISLVLGISYYKLYVPPKISLSQPMSEKQAEFWNTVYRKGLGEFWYRNNLDPAIFLGFPVEQRVPEPGASRRYGAGLSPIKDRALVGIGGGKDSIVVAELLKREGIDVTAFVVETERGSAIVEDVIEALEIPALRVKRFLDPKIFEKHPDSYNGHVPVSAMYAWLGILLGTLAGYRWVTVGNEYSSDFGNLEYRGEIINHQWSKSSEFERLFQEYVRTYVTQAVHYFSLLRPFHEIRITEQLTQLPIWKAVKTRFSSCNRNFLHHPTTLKLRGAGSPIWCGACPKCAFMFAMLAAFVPKDELVGIFDKNLFADEKLFPLYNDLLGWGELKPFDCVGTFEETQAAFVLAAHSGYHDEAAIRHFLPRIAIEEAQVRHLLRAQPAETLPDRFRFAGVKNVLILGYGREGKITEQFLQQRYPEIEVGIADQKDDENYLAKQATYDLTIKTPGIPKNKVTGYYTTATNIFFSRVSNVIVGVTGSKGKSTTASLIYEMLKAGGKEVQFLGNIGTPMLSALREPIPAERIFVLELSSQQLEDLRISPAVAVVTTLFPEHMDYHGSVAAYYEAKKNIIRHQKSSDFFVYDPQHPQLQAWAQEARGKAIPFTDNVPIERSEIPLLGEHNLKNVAAAVATARHLGISDADIARAIKNFKPLPHRLEFVGEFRGIMFYDNASSTTPESTVAALTTIPNLKTIFLGGLDRGYDFTALVKAVRETATQNVVLFPDTGARIQELLPKSLRFFQTESMEEAVRFAYAHTPAGGAVLLSAASPSYSLWTNFDEQGNEFQQWVKTLA